MKHIPDIIGYRLEEALKELKDLDLNIIIEESFGKNSVKTEKIRVLRQVYEEKDNTLQLITAYF